MPTLDIPYGTHGQKLDLYENPGVPVVLFIHEGGWTDGDKSQASMSINGRPSIVSMLSHYETIVPNYRLDPEYTFPAQSDDIKEALEYAITQAAGRPVGLVGFSAGGNVALLAAMLDPRVSTIVTWSGPTDLVYMLAHNAAVKPIQKYLGGASAKDASPYYQIQGGIFPIQLHGSLTDFVPHIIQNNMASALVAAGNDAEVHIWARGHAQSYSRFAWSPTLAWLAVHLS